MENLQALCTICHSKIHGIEPKTSELKTLIILRDRLIKIRKSYIQQKKSFKNIEIIVPVFWIEEIKKLTKAIKAIEKELKIKVETHENWNFLNNIDGISYITASKLIAYLNPRNFETVSKIWRYCGLDANYIKRKRGMKQEETKRCGNPYIKKELLGILAVSFIRQKNKKYREIYDKEKAKQLSKSLTKIHTHKRAMRKMIKCFLIDYWKYTHKKRG